MNNNSVKVLKYSLLAGAVYFFCISIAHVLGVKVPGLFIYYNIPSHQYQDSIISFLAFGWAAFFYTASQYPRAVKPVLLSSIVALSGLVYINLSTDFSAIAGAVSTLPFWFQVSLLFVYVGELLFFSIRVRAEKA